MMRKCIVILSIIGGILSSFSNYNDMFSNDTTKLKNDKVTYKISQDETNFYLSINTRDPKTMMAMLNLGVTTFFDIKGKKKQNVYVKYPSEPLKRGFGRQEKRQRGGARPNEKPRGEDSKKEGNDIKNKVKEILENDYPQEAEYSYFKDSEEFHVMFKTLNIAPKFTFNEEQTVLFYNLVVPKTLLIKDSEKNFEKLTIGVKTIKEKIERDNDGGLNGSLGGISLGSAGQRGGNQRGGNQRGGGQRAGGQRGGGQGGQPNDNPSKDVLLDFWFALTTNTE
ncbi:hypothetical protein [Croceitalea vernalis]|uniref:DUF4412 domain-containing protein n=1 Tax=Croceitalea vernalis TaxID=3075599 RepID=A0ABU3BIA5_9FLAO|nr:hypothetical protein [Croceitalea sp. P007]MDT0621901.1 hypothetical protein [Croceitalea sp. P007]